MSNGIVTNWSESPPHPPFVTVAISLLCGFALLIYSGLSPLMQQAMIDIGGMQPLAVAELLHRDLADWWDWPALTLFTSLFVHANGLHLLGNLAYLWVFGIKVEQRLGPIGMCAVFLLGGALSNVMVVLRVPQMETPIIGASGAVSAVVGAYLALFPRRRIGLFLPLGLYLQFARVPALLVIGSWFTLQLLYTAFGPIDAAVAWWTHLAGFALGISFALVTRALTQYRL
ncbi:MAG: rhomboid family intramembrane serine protease [Xanthomonadales bacterium]|nr:rhomboid family intramembrane serine protease [Gammaproteobacteria bacterium]MBT8063688.1 rhomboid family intramembrane serine protease [Gammaproteobacteria bacterium]NNJ64058.1 rhomboid family intramembrane serine protease [Xanthomonadales bacterium]NNK32437.1 rhomboid family intramembrane serine protease [Xanthomonadales bacterium]NNK37727.1 rhomboid family intramembrane serine protease [Xanthomonadales bacterium]